MYKPLEEELAEARAKRKLEQTPLQSEEEKRRERLERDLKELESRHIGPFLNWPQLNEAMKIHVRHCPQYYPAFYTDECPDTGNQASSVDKRPHLPDEDPKYGKEFWGTPFHALMVSINNYEKYNFKQTKHDEQELKILQHIKEVNPAVNALHM